MSMSLEITTKKRPINLTIRADILDDAKSLNLNTSQAAEAGIQAAIKRAREEQWLTQSQSAFDAQNDRISKNGLLLQPSWATE